MSRPGDASDYRPDIDGLRAVAVLAVVVYHARSTVLPGGFVGVDIFFVISGYLISRIIFTRLERRSFSLLDFYRRRALRNAPAMFAVVGATLAAAHWMMLPRDSADVARASVFSAASLANVYFWLYPKAGYFDADVREMPLLHLWSLGVEEQFYLLWPLVLLAIGRAWRSHTFFAVAAVAAAASFALGDVLFPRDAAFVYYMMPTRAGELLVGALVSAFTLRHPSPLAPAMRGLLDASGAAAIAGSLLFYNGSTVFPGVRALLPTLGTAALLLTGRPPHPGLVTRVLSSKPLVAIGLISYSVYLWHWPLLAFYRYGYGELTAAAQWLLPALALIIGAASYALVEQPTRALRLAPVRAIVLAYALPAAAIGVAGVIMVYGPRVGVPVHSQRYLTALAAVNDDTQPAEAFDYVCQRKRIRAADLSDPRCVVGARAGGEPRVLVWGDSNAAHYIGVLGRAAERAAFRFRSVAADSCPPILTDPAPFVDARRLDDCREFVATAGAAARRFPVVVLGGTWTTYRDASPAFLPALTETVDRLVADGAFVLLLGKVPVFPRYDRRCLQKQVAFPFLTCPVWQLPVSEDVRARNDELRALAARSDAIEYFDLTPYVCPDGVCRSSGSDGQPLYYDPSHVSMAASWRL
jgi:peptidoglycan/LPS O-acetylase OafA/YrhL